MITRTFKLFSSLFLLASFIVSGIANAGPLLPGDFGSVGSVSGNVVIDTNLLTINGGAGGIFLSQGGGAPDIAVFAFDDGSALGNVTVTGSNAVALLFQGSGSISGTIDVSGNNGFNSIVAGSDHGGWGTGVAGGGRGGSGGPFQGGLAADGFVRGAGVGPGGGVLASSSATSSGAGSGSGGGFGTEGGAGGAGTTGRPGGNSYGDLIDSFLSAGSGGAGGGGFSSGLFGRGGGGGAGGGAIEIGASNTLNLLGASILANGGNGGDGTRGGGGGSGGGIRLHGYNINISSGSLISANGGNGGSLLSAAGGCGGAGRIAILSNSSGSLNNAGTVTATTGLGNSSCPSGNIVSIINSPDIGQAPVSSVPEPGSTGLLLLGLLGLSRRFPASRGSV